MEKKNRKSSVLETVGVFIFMSVLLFVTLALIMRLCNTKKEEVEKAQSAIENTDIITADQQISTDLENVLELEEYGTEIFTEDVTIKNETDSISSEDKTKIEEVYNEVKENYMSGDWNGQEIQYKGHTIKLDTKDYKSGYILIDGEKYKKENLDLPNNMDFSNVNSQNYQYIPGEGTYIIENCKLVKYLRGNKIDLQGSELIPEKIKDKKNYDRFYLEIPNLVYDYINNRLFLLYDENETAYYPRELYVFKDYNISELELVNNNISEFWIDEEVGLTYETSIYTSIEKEGIIYSGYLYSNTVYENE